MSNYNRSNFTSDVYDDNAVSLLKILRSKGVVKIEGAHKTGKTFIAKRLAYVLTRDTNSERIGYVACSNSITYANFVGTITYTGKEGIRRKGVLLNFIDLATKDPDNDYIIILDDVDNVDLRSLMGNFLQAMLISNRDIPVTYAKWSSTRIKVPNNILFILTGNVNCSEVNSSIETLYPHYRIEPAYDTQGFKMLQSSIDAQNFANVVKAIKKFNAGVSDKDDLIGHGFLCDNIKSSDDFKDIIRYEIIPYVERIGHKYEHYASVKEQLTKILLQ